VDVFIKSFPKRIWSSGLWFVVNGLWKHV